MSLKNIRVVLVEPLYGGNVGSVCRAMANMGLSDLTVVNERPDLDFIEARTMAFRAVDLFEARRHFSSLAEAVADCGLVAGASARVGLYRDHSHTPRSVAPLLLDAANTQPVALVFGREDKGLRNDEIALCTQIIQIPSSTDYLSLNLSKAVMVCCYELFVASGAFEPSTEKSPEASSVMRERMFAMWEETLLSIGFMEEQKSQHMMLGLRRILSRGTLTDKDVHILMGMARQSQWCATQVKNLKKQLSELDTPPAEQ